MDRNTQYTLSELHDLADRQLSGSASNKGMHRLEAILREDRDAREQYLQYLLVHAQLPLTSLAMNAGSGRSNLGAMSAIPLSGALSGKAGVAIVSGFVTALAVLFVGLMSYVGIPDGATQELAGQQTPADAHYYSRPLPINLVASVEYADDENQPAADRNGRIQEISATTLRVGNGEKSFSSHSGARVRVMGPAIFGVSAPSEGHLYEGSVHTKLAEPNATFSVLTPNLRFLDVGTEFRVSLVNDHIVKLEVLEGEVEVQARIRKPRFLWSFDDIERPLDAADVDPAVRLGPAAKVVEGIVGARAVAFDNTESAFVSLKQGTAEKVGNGDMACSGGITVEALFVSHWNANLLDYDEIFRKDDSQYRILLSFQNDEYHFHDCPRVPDGPVLSFGIHIEDRGYSELDMPLDGQEGRPTLAQLTDGKPHHVVATYDSFSGRKSLYIDGRLRFKHSFPRGSLLLSGGPEEAQVGNWESIEPFNGIIDEVALYDFALTPAEIAAHWSNAKAGKPYFAPQGSLPNSPRWKSLAKVPEGEERLFDQRTGFFPPDHSM